MQTALCLLLASSAHGARSGFVRVGIDTATDKAALRSLFEEDMHATLRGLYGASSIGSISSLSFSLPVAPSVPVVPPVTSPVAEPVGNCPDPVPTPAPVRAPVEDGDCPDPVPTPVMAPVATPIAALNDTVTNSTLPPPLPLNTTTDNSTSFNTTNATVQAFAEQEEQTKKTVEVEDNLSASQIGMIAVLSVAALLVVAAAVIRKKAVDGKAAAAAGSDASTVAPHSQDGSPARKHKPAAEF